MLTISKENTFRTSLKIIPFLILCVINYFLYSVYNGLLNEATSFGNLGWSITSKIFGAITIILLVVRLIIIRNSEDYSKLYGTLATISLIVYLLLFVFIGKSTESPFGVLSVNESLLLRAVLVYWFALEICYILKSTVPQLVILLLSSIFIFWTGLTNRSTSEIVKNSINNYLIVKKDSLKSLETTDNIYFKATTNNKSKYNISTNVKYDDFGFKKTVELTITNEISNSTIKESRKLFKKLNIENKLSKLEKSFKSKVSKEKISTYSKDFFARELFKDEIKTLDKLKNEDILLKKYLIPTIGITLNSSKTLEKINILSDLDYSDLKNGTYFIRISDNRQIIKEYLVTILQGKVSNASELDPNRPDNTKVELENNSYEEITKVN